MDLTNEQPAVEVPFIFYNLALAGFWFLRAAPEPVTPFMVFLHLGLVFLLMEMSRFGVRSRLPFRLLRRLFPYVMWALAWSEIGWLFRLTSPLVHDGGVKALDLALFGFHWNEVLSRFFPWGWVQNAMGFSYLSYYLLIIGPPLGLAFRRQEGKMAHHTFGLMSTYLACFLFYLAMPVIGPRDLAQAVGENAMVGGGLFGPLIHAFFEAGDSLGTAFPSSHCAGSVASALLVRRHFGRVTGQMALIWAGFIVVSTVYTNNHYAVDAVAGVALAVLILKVFLPCYSRLNGRILMVGLPSRSSAVNMPSSGESSEQGGIS